MLEVKKSKILLLGSFLILFAVLISSFYSFDKNMDNLKRMEQRFIEKHCQGNYETSQIEEICNQALLNQNIKLDFFTALTNIVVFSGTSGGIGFHNLSYIMILFIIVPSLYYICNYLKNNVIVNKLTRQSYKKSIFKFLFKAYIPALILPLIGIIAIIISYFYAPNFDFAMAIKNGTTTWSIKTLSNPYLFMFLYVINLLVHGVLYINIALCVSRKHHNFFIATILSFLVYIAIEVFLEVGLGGILFTSILHMNDKMTMFNIMNMFVFNDTVGILSPIIVPFLIMILTFIMVTLFYKNKEKLVIDCEKNIRREEM